MIRLLVAAGLMPFSLWSSCAGLLPTQYVIDSWGAQDGLPEERIVSITQTPDGYLWLATLDGMVRFDGRSFEVLRFGESQTAPGSYWRTIFSTRAGVLLGMRPDQRLV